MRGNRLHAFHCVIVYAAFAVACAPAFATGDLEDEAQKGEKPDILELMLNFPFRENADLDKVHGIAEEWQKLLREQNKGALVHFDLLGLFAEVQAFTSTNATIGEGFFIVSFAESADKALRRLRDDIGLAPPPGGAIVRTYTSVLAIPESIRSRFKGETGAVTRWCRFIAIVAGGRSQQEFDDVLSHELVHAFLSSTIGVKRDNLPRWFHEGVALYLSDAKDLYLSPTGHESGKMSWSPKDYVEFKRTFEYLESSLGREGLNRLIRQSVSSGSVNESLWKRTTTSDYRELKDRAIEKRREQVRDSEAKSIAVVIVVAVFIFWFFTRGR